jgi:hypothetical protein
MDDIRGASSSASDRRQYRHEVPVFTKDEVQRSFMMNIIRQQRIYFMFYLIIIIIIIPLLSSDLA